ncbi:MAG: hypothetical protein QOJ07_3826 [Thermoleophilaceae bacterium]|jgi:hypothetical protein|nr:hypothetical protein [Thermoleophilaceae bacterium]
MAYAIENARYQWEDGERRLRQAGELEREDLETAVWAVLDELRRRLGSTFSIEELVEFYASGTDWAEDLAHSRRAGLDAGPVVDAAFNRYAREASDFAGGRMYAPDR